MTSEEQDSIAVSLIKEQISRCEATIARYQGEEHIGVRIGAASKIVMLEEIIKGVNETRERLNLPAIS